MTLRILIIALFTTLSFNLQAQQTFTGTNGQISFYSNAPLELINATSGKASGSIDLKDNKLTFSVPVRSFQFDKSLMQEHFNEKYLESHRFPKAYFSGYIANNVDISQPGLHEVVVKGLLTIHGVANERTLQGTILNERNHLILKSDFVVALEHHRIMVPEAVTGKIAEKIDVKVKMQLLPDKPLQGAADKTALHTTF